MQTYFTGGVSFLSCESGALATPPSSLYFSFAKQYSQIRPGIWKYDSNSYALTKVIQRYLQLHVLWYTVKPANVVTSVNP